MSTMTSGASYVELMVLPEVIPSSSISVRMLKYLQTKIMLLPALSAISFKYAITCVCPVRFYCMADAYDVPNC